MTTAPIVRSRRVEVRTDRPIKICLEDREQSTFLVLADGYTEEWTMAQIRAAIAAGYRVEEWK